MKKFMKNSLKKVFIAALGPGEISQGMAFAKYALSKGSAVSFAVLRKSNLPFLPKTSARFQKLLAPTPRKLNALVEKSRPDVLVLCNSKMFSWDAYFINHPPDPKPLTVSIDSNWLFFKESPYQSLPWTDRHYINLPKKVFRFGQKEFGGHYRISHEMLKKIKVVGMIPSYKSLPARVRSPIRRKYAKPGEKLIFLYASVGGLIKPEVFGTLTDVVEALCGQSCRIRVVHAGDYGLPRREQRRYPWLTYAGPVTTDEFYAILASSDLIFQHQGLGTLAQAISAGVPAIANVKDVRDERSPWHAHAWEVEPFARAGACMFFSFSDPIKKIITAIESLLYDEKKRQRMRQDQKAIYSAGELVVFEDIKRLLNCASR
ncbi:MAG: hypothetical protein A3H69_03625 [Candidatus Sungbacteria bacterium RIFCSPLOWO2_02_FULL_47_9]|uniref:Glycosyl transferase family 28 C-terminal domain-containing protein n=1 Tax=Candidatus Sungbacteria bacterium RIFCSPHIGHO2_01_FULL_47_32 TaxID=1802264 RepID=A0A1G2K912_9BACT|nr:MAG: hypothetical protein UX72_C0005G0024 [Parcubacteria group bacterium GW2011_GWA2_47_10]OGZ95919.1 MAG: hypothetical protein A2633_02440 [Candidatus Sungbacteria bacterium RIFCSPHIGHO2_01_FULL_47_32]OGZ98884.1 MAG: hypothetical protein A3D57_01820 [Candidatus Sungbacteria bacterium RIFCSPHIGHO2_02_FULL_46_12]OHA06179.1 MAG: hypothetical protein A3A28_01045 [Candidatus Sungbacteria bacterium RIFCSPLOWO2_01_FULL_47_32]OHA12091.1 MAG: hypothetical protein A3H69_03625 [Candidatus Sungbacteria